MPSTPRKAALRIRGNPGPLTIVGPMDEGALATLRRHGYSPADILGVGMEGTVIDLSGGTVAKVWHSRSRNDLDALLEFGLALDAAPIPFATAGALELLDDDGSLITIERKVDGLPLRSAAQQDPPVAGIREARIMGDVLAGLSGASDPRLGSLPVLPGEPAIGSGVGFGPALARLVERRFTVTKSRLREHVPDIDLLAELLVSELRALPIPARASLIHGDLVPANVLVAGNEVSGVLDFGFLTMLGDAQFDAAITACVFDMYGVNARRSEDFLTEYFRVRFDHDERTYVLYRGAYAIITHAVFGDDLSDGHFAWCVRMLRRAELLTVLRM